MDAKTLTKAQLDVLPIGAAIVVKTADRKRAFCAVKNADAADMYDTQKAAISFVWRANGTLSHIVRWPVSAGCFPTETKLVEINLEQ